MPRMFCICPRTCLLNLQEQNDHSVIYGQDQAISVVHFGNHWIAAKIEPNTRPWYCINYERPVEIKASNAFRFDLVFVVTREETKAAPLRSEAFQTKSTIIYS